MTITYPAQRIARFLTDDGLFDGEESLLGDHDSVDFWIAPGAGITYLIDKMIVTIEDVGVMTPVLYGGITALTNGVELWVKTAADAVLVRLDSGINIKNNAGWMNLADRVFNDYLAAVAGIVQYVLDFKDPILLAGGDKLGVTLDDNTAGLVGHHIFVTGIASSVAGAPDVDIV